MFNQNGRAVSIHPYGNILHIPEGLDVPQSPHHEFRFAHFHQSATHVVIAAFDGHFYPGKRNVVSLEFIGIYLHLVLLHKSPDAGHLGHTRYAHQPIAQVPVLNRAELLQIVFVPAIQHVFVHPTHSRGVGAQGGSDSLGQASGHVIQIFQHPAARPVQIGSIFENDVHKRETEEGIPAYCFGIGHGQHGAGQRVGYLIFHHLRCLTGIFGKNNHLHIAQIRYGIHRRLQGH